MLRWIPEIKYFYLKHIFSDLIKEGLWADRNKRKNTSSASSADDDSTVDVGQKGKLFDFQDITC